MTSHRALSIDDIVVSIFDKLEEEGQRATLASCAQCCRFFSELALDTLWRSLSTTEGVLDILLPQDPEGYDTPKVSVTIRLCTEDFTSGLIRVMVMQKLLDAEWARFDFYANRVHYVEDKNELSDFFYKLSALRTGIAPLPKIKHLSLFDVPPFRLHLPRHVCSLDIRVPLRLGGKSAQTILAQFSSQVPLLEKLKLCGAVPTTILPVITTFSHLCSVDLDQIDLPRPLDHDAFDTFVTALSRMPVLAKLYLPRLRGGEPAAPACGGFSRLEMLSSWDTPQTLSRFVQALDTRNLRRIHIASRISSTSELHSCLKAIASTHGHSIRAILFERGYDLEDLAWMDTIRPLLSISTMMEVVFPQTMISLLSVTDARELANAWPRLTKIENLRFCDLASAYEVILLFCRLCPALLYLDMYINEPCINPFPEVQALSSPHPLQTLYVDFSETAKFQEPIILEYEAQWWEIFPYLRTGPSMKSRP